MLRTLATSGIVFSSIAAACQLTNGNYFTGVETDTNLCMGQGEGQWTFGMSVSLSDVPAPGGTPDVGAGSSTTFYIFDNACNIMSTYTPGSCGVPWIIEENFLADVLTITRVEMDVGQPYFSFNYGNGVYSINNNHCVCNSDDDGLTAGQGCRCAFPVDGYFTG
ncbi:hypothetical protein N7510_010040 [Penicillium lagena]|uniref:uncharacterized protein n=1 Tax=Penicillium lagena TaxID=94218 RepID=UPI00253F9B93|nr:uncharacterized protein N7510_010040 [Penicillium lagena]KAJ5604886.1 hypothetical protein N7510_010040 [Penicillium lagena]